MTKTSRRASLGLILISLLATVLAGTASAFEIKLGPMREQAIKWLMDTRHLSRASAEQEMRRASRQNRAEVLDSVEIPDGAIADFVKIDATQPGKPTVQSQGCFQMFSPYSEEGRRFWAAVERTKGTPAYDNFMKAFEDAIKRGFFVQKLTPAQVARMKDPKARTRGMHPGVYAGWPKQCRLLIAAPIMPYWDDVATGPNAPPHPHFKNPTDTFPEQSATHPVNYSIVPYLTSHLADASHYQYISGWFGYSLGGGWSNGSPTGLNNPSWNNSGQFTPLGTGHPEIQRFYNMTASLVSHWWTFVFDTSNPNSLVNWWRANSHGQLQITGDSGNPGNIAGWMESAHCLEATDYGDVTGYDYLPYPGTPIIRQSSIISGASAPANGIIRASLNGTQFSVLYYQPYWNGGGAGQDISHYTFHFGSVADGGFGSGGDTTHAKVYDYTAHGGSMVIDPYDGRHVTFTGITYSYVDTVDGKTKDASGGPGNGGAPYWSMDAPTGTWGSGSTGYMNVGQGCGALSNTLITQAELLQKRGPSDLSGPAADAQGSHRLMSLCYYTHDHFPGTGTPRTVGAGQPSYQLMHPSTNGYVDDLMGTDAYSAYNASTGKTETEHIDREIPYDHSWYDDQNYPTGGYFHVSTQVYNAGGHSTAGWEGDVNKVLADNKWNLASYDAICYIWPAGANVPQGANIFIAMGQPSGQGAFGNFCVPENVGLGTMAHESGHALANFVDLYDSDLYWNGQHHIPTHTQEDAMGPYSVMGNGGLRADAYNQIVSAGFFDATKLAADYPAAPIPESEGSLQYPIIYEVDPNNWGAPNGANEYYWIENRNRTLGSYFGDPSPRGMYIYHLDARYGPGAGGPFGQGDTIPFGVIMEQADGLYQLETQLAGWNIGQWNAGNQVPMNGDPFPGSLNIVSFNQLGTIDSSGLKKSLPNTYSNNESSGGNPVANTSYDTFFRADNISNPGANMTADLWVEPHELIVTSGSGTVPTTCTQGQTNVPVLFLHLDNNNTSPNISKEDVVIQRVLVDESGGSKNDSDTTRALLYWDSNSNNIVEPGTDVLLSTATVTNQQADLTGFSFRVPVGATRDLIVCYDVSGTANTGVTLGAAIAYADPDIDPNYPRSAITCQIPGTIQSRVRLAAAPPNNLGLARFPVQTASDRVIINPGAGVLTITPTNLVPTPSPYSVLQGTKDVPMLGLKLDVSTGSSVTLTSLTVDASGGGLGTSTRAGDVSAKLYLDANMNGVIDSPADTLLGTAFFGLTMSATFDSLSNYTVVAGTDRGLIIAYDFATDATVGKTVVAYLKTKAYVTLKQPAYNTVAATNFPMSSTEAKIISDPGPYLRDTAGNNGNDPTSPSTYAEWLTPANVSPPKHPITGPPSTAWTWTAVYYDSANQAPTKVQVFLDGTPCDMTRQGSGTPNYVTGVTYSYSTTTNLILGTHTYYMYCEDIAGNARYPAAPNTRGEPVVVDTQPTLSDSAGNTREWLTPPNPNPPPAHPITGPSNTMWTWTAIYTDAEGELPSKIQVVINGTGHDLQYSGPKPTAAQIKAGVKYTFQTLLPIGNYNYYVTCNDGVTGHADVRFPAATTYPEPIVIDDTPQLTDSQGGSRVWLTQGINANGPATTNWLWKATYTDADNQAPSVIQVVIDGTAHDMQKVDVTDTTYTDGCTYFWQMKLAKGSHSYYITCTDTGGGHVVRYPANAPDVYPNEPVVGDTPPTLKDTAGGTSAWVTPTTGGSNTQFTWTAVYTDAENEAPNPIQVFIDGTAHPMLPSDPSDTDYTNGATFYYQTKLAAGTHTYYLFCSDGVNNVRKPTSAPDTYTLTVTDNPPALADAAGGTREWLTPSNGTHPITGPVTTTWKWRAKYTDADNEAPNPIQVFIDGTAYTMLPEDPSNTNYAGGVWYYYQTQLVAGTHSYYLRCSDTSGNVARYPTAPATYPEPVVGNDTAPTLKDTAGGQREWLTPNQGTHPISGGPNTRWTWTAVYTDAENEAPQPIQVFIDGTAYPMQPSDPSDTNYKDGATFYYQMRLPAGNHTYYLLCSDGVTIVRYPTTAPDTYPEPIVVDNPPALADTAGGTREWLTPSDGTHPITGSSSTQWTWTAVYTDAENEAPAPIQVWIDGTAYPMVKQDPTANNYRSGVTYLYQTQLAVGNHFYCLTCNDGVNPDVYYPSPAPNTYPEPTVTNSVPTLADVQGGASQWLFPVNADGSTPPTGPRSTAWKWRAVYTDADNDPPNPIQVWIDGTPHNMVPENPNDKNYRDGAIFSYQTPLPVGTHSYYLLCNDGTNPNVRFPAKNATPNTYPGPIVVNIKPVLSNGTVTPFWGAATDSFTFTVTFTDGDGDLPAFINVRIDGGAWLAMSEVDPADTNTTDGKNYQYTLIPPPSLTPGPHTFDFEANDGYDTVHYPAAPASPLPGPVILAPATGFFADQSYSATTGPYEEGLPIFIQIKDLDQNADPTKVDTLDCTVTSTNTADSETITLTETGPNTGRFRTPAAGFPTLGKAGAANDGVLNEIAGKNGDTLTLSYTDPHDATDVLTAQIQVTDTIAPVAIAADQITAAASANGDTIHLNWTDYPEVNRALTPKQVDVAQYRVFYADTKTPIGTLTPVATVPAGTQKADIPTGGPDGDKYVAVAVDDEVPNTNKNVYWVTVNTADHKPPKLTAQDPADGQTDVPCNTTISFQIDDDGGSGTPKANIKVELNQSPADGTTFHDITSGCVITGTAPLRKVSYASPVPLLWNQKVTVKVTATDAAGNTMVDSFKFLTTTDHQPPTVANRLPDAGATNVPVDTTIAFDLLDPLSGVQAATIHATVQGTDVTKSLQITGTPAQAHVLYDPPTPFKYGEVVHVGVDARDLAGNVMVTQTYSFTTLPDSDKAFIDSLSPANGATNVPITTSISFHIQDAVSGVDKSSIALSVMGTPVTLTDQNIQQLSPNAYVVTYQPAAPLPYAKQVQCEASGRDLAGNPKVTVAWSFQTQLTPTYAITGTVYRQGASASTVPPGAVGVPGVKLAVTDVATGTVVQTVQADGNGVYQVINLLAGRYKVTPSLAGWTFTPASQTVVIGPRNPNGDASGVDFEAQQALYSVSGRITVGGAGLPGVTVSDGTRTATTDADGKYTIPNVPSGAYTVVPALINYTFNPASRVAVVKSAPAVGIDFTTQAGTFTVSGTVSDTAGNRLSGIEVRLQGGAGVAVTSAAGLYTLRGVPAGNRTFVASGQGYHFQPQQTMPIDVESDLTGINFTGYPVLSHSFPAGRQFVGVPTTPQNNDPAQLFGTTNVVRWSPTATPARWLYYTTDQGNPLLQVAPAAGFFVSFDGATTLQVPGTPVPLDQQYPFVINQGWNMAANPFEVALPWANLKPVTADTMAPYGFVLENGEYVLVSSDPDLGGRTAINAWEGVWLMGNMASATIMAQPPGLGGTAVTHDTVKRTADRDHWLFPVAARAAGRVDASNGVGVSAKRGAIKVPNPPALRGSVDVVLQGAGGEALAYDLRPSLGNGLTWNFNVVTDLTNTRVEVQLPDLSEVPNDLTVTLVDVAAGKRLYARTMPSYVYNSGQGGARAFRLEVSARVTGGLTVRAAGANLGHQGAAITYVLSQPAQVRAQVLNMAGRLVRTLSQADAVDAGTNTLLWDLSSDAHTLVPGGRYLVVIEATTPDGQRARALQNLSVTR